ncbi:hypothetical protein TELCIR_00670 [Teladorsagia circumcincta]|uniref:AMP-binding enzyme n=1 Tax=Teladorsagia circumcincta TaxID=45464 RepID=A0A2G9V405_TELCI|nr:hypothetical protein TELCIR_00670 [Teladorsagia circumcincta]
MKNFQPRILITEPTQIVSLLKQPMSDDFKLSSMQYVLCGGPSIGKRVRKRFLERFPGVKYMTNGAGLLETAPAAMIPNIGGRENHDSTGCAVSTGDIKVVCSSTGRQLEVEEKGELCVRGPTVTQGYMSDDSHLDEDGWHHTGQIGHIDKYGNVFIAGSQSDLIEVDGQQIPLAEVEDALLTHPSITDAAVIRVTVASKEQKAKAFVVQRDETLTAEDVHRFVDGQVTQIFKGLLTDVEFVYRIPRGVDGHVLRHQLQSTVPQEEIEEVVAS